METEASVITGGDKEVVSILSVMNDQRSSVSHAGQTIASQVVVVAVDGFGMLNDSGDSVDEQQMVTRYTFKNMNRMTVQVITYGATVTSIRVPNKNGVAEDVVLGFDNLADYVSADRYHFGGTLGRCCNRFSDGRFKGKPQEGDDVIKSNALQGFHKHNWTAHLCQSILTMTYVSESDEYAGAVMARATFELKSDNSFHVSYAATTSQPTPINLTSNCFFNLAGHQGSHNELYKHIVTINADRVIEQDTVQRTPTGRILCVGATIMDLRVPHELGPAIARCPSGGYDHLMCITQGIDQRLTFAARVVHPLSGRVLEMYTDQPLLEFYTANRLPDPFNEINPREVYTQDFFELPSSAPLGQIGRCHSIAGEDASRDDVLTLCEDENDVNENGEEMLSCSCYSSTDGCCRAREPICGKKGAQYRRHAAFCLNSQNYPDDGNHKYFPYPILYPGQMYTHEIVYKFGLRHCLVADQFGFENTNELVEDDEYDGYGEEQVEDEDVPLE